MNLTWNKFIHWFPVRLISEMNIRWWKEYCPVSPETNLYANCTRISNTHLTHRLWNNQLLRKKVGGNFVTLGFSDSVDAWAKFLNNYGSTGAAAQLLPRSHQTADGVVLWRKKKKTVSGAESSARLIKGVPSSDACLARPYSDHRRGLTIHHGARQSERQQRLKALCASRITPTHSYSDMIRGEAGNWD